MSEKIPEPRGFQHYVRSEHMSFERIVNASVMTFYRPEGEIEYSLWEIPTEKKFTDDINKALREAADDILHRLEQIVKEKRYAYYDEEERVEKYVPYEGEIMVRIGNDGEKITVEEWKQEVLRWLSQ